jgi:alanyl-tRNA synthetase
MTSDEIRERFLAFFESRDHRRQPSAPLIPRNDPSTLLISAGMHPLKPYFLGQEPAPHHRLTSCQKCFRTVDIDQIGSTYRHLTFFEMLGNFSIGDYFKQGAVEFAWEFSLEGFGFDPEKIWVTVFEGDEELGLGLDEEAVEAWLAVGVPRERIVALPRSENFWQPARPGPCGPCSELYLDRGLEFGAPDDLPGGENERFLEYWNLVFMQYDQDPEGTLTPLPAQNIDTGLGLNRLAAIMQNTTSVFETDQLRPLIDLAEELSGKRYETDFPTDRAMRILADHSRGCASDRRRGRALQRGARLRAPPPDPQSDRAGPPDRHRGRVPAPLPADRLRDHGLRVPELVEQSSTIGLWLGNEERAFNQTLEQGMRKLDEIVERTLRRAPRASAPTRRSCCTTRTAFPSTSRSSWRPNAISGSTSRASRRSCRHSASGEGGSGARRGRRRPRAHRGLRGERRLHHGVHRLRDGRADDGDRRVAQEGDRLLAKLVESPFYATGGGQVNDHGVVRCEDGGCAARVLDVIRVGDDQALVLEPLEGELHEGERVVASVDAAARRATEANHTATHLLHAALRERLGSHVRQAGSYVGPDKLRFDFTHGAPLSHDDVAWVENRVNELVLANQPVRALTTTLDEARKLGAMALFGEKYGDVVRMVEVGDGTWSRELCGGTHVRSTAEIGVFKLTTETSSAANVRRIEAITGPAAVRTLRRHDRLLAETAVALRTAPENVPEVAAERERERRQLLKGARTAAPIDDRLGDVVELDGLRAVFELREVQSPKQLPDLADRMKNQLGDPAVVVLGAGGEGRANLLVAATAGAIERGVKAGEIVKIAAKVVGGGGGGRDTMAQAGGREPEKLPDALAAARAEIERVLAAG